MFAFESAIAHACCLIFWDKYTDMLSRGVNRFRWWEYANSSSLMIALISMLFGVYDIYSLILIFMINASMCFFGDLFEVQNAGKQPNEIDWSAFIYGSISGLYGWVIIFTFMVGSPSFSFAPNFVWAILYSYLILFCTFPATMYV